MFHCKECDSCIDYHHKHSNFLGKCIGRDNAIAYFWFLFINTILNAMFVVCLINCINMPGDSSDEVQGTDEAVKEDNQQPSGMLLSLVGCFVAIYEHAYILLGSALLLTIHLTLANFDKLLQMSLSIGNLATMRETSDLWMHTHLFRVEQDDYMDPVARVRQDIEAAESHHEDANRDGAEPGERGGANSKFVFSFESHTFCAMFIHFLWFIVTGRHGIRLKRRRHNDAGSAMSDV